MKNGYVLVDHHGDNGTVREGSIIRDLSDQRFNALERRGLIRDADKGGSSGKKDPEPSNKKAAEPSNKGKAES